METHDTIQRLVERAREGDSEAFEQLVCGCRDSLEKCVRMRLGNHLRAEVEVQDVLQETYAQALHSVARFQWTGKGSFDRWMRGIAEHVILNLARRQRKSPILYIEIDKPHAGPSPSKLMRRGERFDRLEDAINNLSPEYREAMFLVRIKGLQINEAASRMNRTPQAVKHILMRAIRKLREAVGDTESFSLPPESFEGWRHDDAR